MGRLLRLNGRLDIGPGSGNSILSIAGDRMTLWHNQAFGTAALRILHVMETIKGGPASHLDEIVPAQVARYGADNIRLIGPANHMKYLVTTPTSVCRTFDDAQVGRLGKTVRLAGAIRRAISDFAPDVIHAHSTFAGVATRVPFRFGRRRIPNLYCPHAWSFAMDVAPWKRRAYALVERGLLPVTDVVVNETNEERDLALAFGLAPDKLRVVANGMAAEPGVFAARALAGPGEEDAVHLLFVGRFVPQKGLDLLIEAARRCDNPAVVIHVVGEAEEGYDPIAGGVPANIRLHGWVSRSELTAFLMAADALVMPSRWEGMPMIALEAMRASLPIIANDIELMRDIVTSDAGLLIDADDADAFANLLATVDRAQLRALGDGARRAFEARFTVDRQVDAFDRLYREILRA